MNRNRIIVDAMGGDNAPHEIIKGAMLACKEKPTMQIVLVGDDKQIKNSLKQFDISGLNFEIVHASQFISMTDTPKIAIEEKQDASIIVACSLLAEKEADGLVSAGNTGATILACSQILQKIDNVERGALSALFPAMKNKPGDPGRTVMLDVGATLHCTPSQLIQFAIMGSHYAREMFEIERPRLGLLNIGEEETKGHDILIEAYSLLKKIDEINFIGNVEGRDVLRGIADVIVSEGFIGNIVLKALEGAAEMGIETGKSIWRKSLLAKLGMTLLAPKLKKIKKRVDYKEYGGAPILGFQEPVIKAHGRSDAQAIKNALFTTDRFLKHDMIKRIKQDIRKYNEVLFEVQR